IGVASTVKISNRQVEQAAKLYAAQLRTRPVGKAGGAGSLRRPDQVELSRESREVQAAFKAIAETPDVRADLVARLKAEIEAGTYHVTGREVARKMLARSLADRLM